MAEGVYLGEKRHTTRLLTCRNVFQGLLTMPKMKLKALDGIENAIRHETVRNLDTLEELSFRAQVLNDRDDPIGNPETVRIVDPVGYWLEGDIIQAEFSSDTNFIRSGKNLTRNVDIHCIADWPGHDLSEHCTGAPTFQGIVVGHVSFTRGTGGAIIRGLGWNPFKATMAGPRSIRRQHLLVERYGGTYCVIIITRSAWNLPSRGERVNVWVSREYKPGLAFAKGVFLESGMPVITKRPALKKGATVRRWHGTVARIMWNTVTDADRAGYHVKHYPEIRNGLRLVPLDSLYLPTARLSLNVTGELREAILAPCYQYRDGIPLPIPGDIRTGDDVDLDIDEWLPRMGLVASCRNLSTGCSWRLYPEGDKPDVVESTIGPITWIDRCKETHDVTCSWKHVVGIVPPQVQRIPGRGLAVATPGLPLERQVFARAFVGAQVLTLVADTMEKLPNTGETRPILKINGFHWII
jgi:hypothetical protein